MRLEPVKKYSIPSYPSKSEVARNPLLLKSIPERWKGNITVGIALSAITALTLTSCGVNNTGSGSNAGGEAGNTSVTDQSGCTQKTQAVVAPVFDHGNGRGSFGCVSVAPPSFLSEEEAFQAIQEEAARYGITFDKSFHELKDVEIPETKLFLRPEEESGVEYAYDDGEINTTTKGSLSIDGVDTAMKIGFEFVSSQDYKQWTVKQNTMSSVEDYDFLAAAQLLQKGISDKNEDLNIGVFYNPMTPFEEIKKLTGQDKKDVIDPKDMNFGDMEVFTKKYATEQLRLQVRDFLEWLKAQGVI